MVLVSEREKWDSKIMVSFFHLGDLESPPFVHLSVLCLPFSYLSITSHGPFLDDNMFYA